MKIGIKLVSGFLIVAALILIVGYFGISSNKNVQLEFNKVSEQTVPIIKIEGDLRLSGLRIVASTSEFSFISSEAHGIEAAQEEKELIKNGKGSFDNAFKQYEYLINKFFPDEKEFLENVRVTGQALKDKSDKIIELKEKGISGQEVLQAKKELEEAEQAFLKTIGAIIAHETKELEDRKAEVNNSITTAQNTIFIVSGIILIVAIVIGLFIARSISVPIQKLTKSIDDISMGILDVEIRGKDRNDEIGKLAQAFERTIVSLKLAMKKAKPSEEKEDKKK